jgi:excisionase family DNA binding protein
MPHSDMGNSPSSEADDQSVPSGTGFRHRSLLDEEFLTVAEIAAMLKLNPQTVRNWIDKGYLPAVRVGRRVRILRSDLQQLLERSRI